MSSPHTTLPTLSAQMASPQLIFEDLSGRPIAGHPHSLVTFSDFENEFGHWFECKGVLEINNVKFLISAPLDQVKAWDATTREAMLQSYR